MGLRRGRGVLLLQTEKNCARGSIIQVFKNFAQDRYVWAALFTLEEGLKKLFSTIQVKYQVQSGTRSFDCNLNIADIRELF